MNWYTKVTENISNLPDFISHYEKELSLGRNDVKIHGNAEKNISSLPGLTEKYFSQLQEVEAVLNYLNIQLRKLKRKYLKHYLEGYNRQLSAREAEKYAEGEDEVIEFEVLINEVALVRNKYLSVIKGLESKNFMLGHLVKLRVAGMEDISI